MSLVQISVTRFLAGGHDREWVEVRTKEWRSPVCGDRLRWSVGYFRGVPVVVRVREIDCVESLRRYVEGRCESAGRSNTGQSPMGGNFQPAQDPAA